MSNVVLEQIWKVEEYEHSWSKIMHRIVTESGTVVAENFRDKDLADHLVFVHNMSL